MSEKDAAYPLGDPRPTVPDLLLEHIGYEVWACGHALDDATKADTAARLVRLGCILKEAYDMGLQHG